MRWGKAYPAYLIPFTLKTEGVFLMNVQSPPLFEAPLAHEVNLHTGFCNCQQCRSNTEFEEEMELTIPATFTPVAVERPGGARIKDKRPPRPADIVYVPGVGGRRIPLHRLAAAAWRALVAEARIDGIAAPLLLPVSGFRSPEHQAELWRRALLKYGSADVAHRYVAPPGGSAHQSGRAIDFYLGGKNDSRNIAHLRTLPAYQWLLDHAEHYGFYPYTVEPWHWEYNPPASSREMESTRTLPPPLIRPDRKVPDTTLFVNINLGREGRSSDNPNRPIKPMTGIFVPQNYRLQPQVDLLLYLHGFHLGQPNLTIAGYWRTLPLRAFREGVNDSQKNVILVAPTLGLKSQAGWLTQRGGFDRYIDTVMAALTTYGPYVGQSPAVGNIILACHSGGGKPMRALALSNQRYTSLIRECWGFDCMYNGGDGLAWAGWANSNPNANLYNYYRNTPQRGTRVESEILQRQSLPNVTVVPLQPGKISHDQVPITYWRTRIQTAAFLLNR